MKISAGSLKAELRPIPGLQNSITLTDNFIILYGGSQMDWFSDGDWKTAEKALRYAAKLAKTLGCKGILWDPEAYKPGKNPWRYSDQEGAGRFTYYEFYAQVRKRGAQFIQALQQEYPGLVVLSLRELSDFQQGSPFSQGLLPVKDTTSTRTALQTSWWGLHLPFTIGILDAINPGVKFIDGNEESYYYTSALEFYKIRNTIKNDARALLPESAQQKFASNYFIGHALSADYIMGNWAGLISFPLMLSGQGKVLTEKERAMWFEHNAYYSFITSDEYVWLYTEKSNWWTGENIPAGFRQALLKAKQKARTGEPLDFAIEDMLKTARQKAAKLPQKKDD